MSAIAAIERAPWAITPDGLRTILRVAERQGNPEAVQRAAGEELQDTRTVTIRGDGVAVVPVVGPLFRYANLFTRISGATSYEILATEFTTALEDSSVRAILLDINSPGGEVIGCQETAELIYRGRGTKPITAHVTGIGASGAYWIASAADQVIASPTALLGSIGVVFAFRDTSRRDARLGIEDVEIISSQSPKKRPNPTSEDGRSQIQRWTDSLAEVFVETVARNRGVSIEGVLKHFGAGDMFVGEEAVQAGLADRVATLEDTIAALAAGRDPARSFRAESRSPASSLPGPTAASQVERLRSSSRRMRNARADAHTEPRSERPVRTRAERRALGARTLAKFRGGESAKRAQPTAAPAPLTPEAQDQVDRLLAARSRDEVPPGSVQDQVNRLMRHRRRRQGDDDRPPPAA